MAVNIISAQRLRELLNYDPVTGIFTRTTSTNRNNKSGDVVGCDMPIGYTYIGLGGRSYYAHRLAWLHVYGEWPKQDIDHINGIKNDNRICNLRDICHQANAHNLQRLNRNNTSGHTGVTWDRRRGKWVAQIKLNRKRFGLGSYSDVVDAAAAYAAAKKRLHMA